MWKNEKSAHIYLYNNNVICYGNIKQKGGEKMTVYEIYLKLFLLLDIHQGEALERIGNLIDKSLGKNEEYLNFHQENQYKLYTFNSLFNSSGEKIFKEGGIYLIKVRTIDEELADYFLKNLANEYTEHIKVLTTEKRSIKQRPIEKLYNITPTVIKTDQGYWKGQIFLDDYERRLSENLIKKYNQFYNTKIDEGFELFRSMEFNNRKPIASSYKNINILGDKLDLYIANNARAQELAFFALGVGIGEMGSRGFGFMNFRPM